MRQKKHSNSPSKIAKYQDQKNSIEKLYQKATNQLKTGELDEEILSKLALPTRKEDKAQEELNIIQGWLTKEWPRGKKKDTIERIQTRIKILEEIIDFWRQARKGWTKKFKEKLKKSAKEKEEK